MTDGADPRKNYFWQVVCEFLTTMVSFVTMPHVTRVLGTDGMGAYTYVLTVSSYFVLLANCGIRVLGSRRIAEVRDDPDARDRVFSGIFSMQLVLSLFAGILFFVFCVFFAGENRALFAVFGISLVSAMLEITWFYHGNERFFPDAAAVSVSKILFAAAVFLFVRDHDDLLLYALLFCASSITVQAVLWAGLYKKVRFVRVPFSEWREYFRPGIALIVPLIVPTVFRTLDKLMLRGFSGDDAVGLYGAAEMLYTSLLGFIIRFGDVMLPRMSHMLANGERRGAEENLSSSLRFSAFLGCAFAFGIASCADVFVPYYFGDAFSGASLTTSLFALGIVLFSFSETVRAQYVIPHKKDRLLVLSAAAGAGTDLVLNAVLIPLFGKNADALGLSREAACALGAIPGTMLAETVLALFLCVSLRRELSAKTLLLPYLRFFLTGAGMLVLVRTVRFALISAGISHPLILLAAMITSGAAFYLIFTLKKVISS